MTATPLLPSMVTTAMKAHRSATAVEDGTRVETFAELNDRTGRMANALVHLTHGAAARVAILLSNCLEYVEMDVAILRAGCAKVPINPRLTSDERTFVLADSAARVLVTERTHEEFARHAMAELDTLESLIVIDGEGPDGLATILSAAQARFQPPAIDPSAPSVILYTSGTTGRPKGAVATFQSRTFATLNMLASELDVREGDGILHAGPLSHGSGSKVLAFALRGARNLLLPKFDPEHFLAEAQRLSATSSFLVPTMMSMLVEAVDGGSATRPPTLRAISYGGAPIAEPQLRRAMEVLGPVFIQVYGSCEAPHPVTVLSRADHVRGLDQPALLSSAGKPALLAEVTIRSDDGSIQPEGEVGEICVGGPSVMSGYWGQAVASEDVLAGGVYASGDLGWLDEEGYLHIVDRKRDMIITGGMNVYAAEVERVIATHPSVAEIAVVGEDDATWGERVVAYVALKPGSAWDEHELLTHCERYLAGYKKPRRMVRVDTLPKGSTGKIDKVTIRALARENNA